MKNETLAPNFYIMAFSTDAEDKFLFVSVFLLLYLAGILVNSTIVSVICVNNHLHTPMYLFLCNLAIVDTCYTTVTIPKLLHMILMENNTMSVQQCLFQLYFFLVAASSEEILLFIMAYDRYVAICNPLHYNHILNRKNCTFLTAGIWASAFLNALLLTISAAKLTICHSNKIRQFFCDVKSLTKTLCTGSRMLYVVIGIDILVLGICPFLFTVISYIKIFNVILQLKSNSGKKKALSTCSSHLTIISIYYGSAVSVYLIPSFFNFMELLFTVFYTTIIPMLNPIIYSLQNSDVKVALRKLFYKKCMYGKI